MNGQRAFVLCVVVVLRASYNAAVEPQRYTSLVVCAKQTDYVSRRQALAEWQPTRNFWGASLPKQSQIGRR